MPSTQFSKGAPTSDPFLEKTVGVNTVSLETYILYLVVSQIPVMAMYTLSSG